MDDRMPPAEPDVRRGHAVDWAAALSRHGRWLRQVVLTRLGERQAVDEVMQEVSLAAVSATVPLGEGPQVAAWLYRVTVSQTLLYRRRSGRRRKLLDAFARRGMPAGTEGRDGSDPLRWILSAERAGLVRGAIARLPRRDADVLVLKYTEHWSYRELAAHLGTTESAVEARLHRARAKLRKELRRLECSEDPP